MPSVTYNGQSFAIDGRRFWVLGATVDYSRIPSECWADRIAAAKQAGFNTIVSSCPWCIHEPRRDRFTFDGDADLAHFVRLCGKQRLRVILRIGPFVGNRFDGGGLPNWLTDIPGIRLREQSEPFLERVITYCRRLLSEVEELQATRGPRGGGPLIMLQIEHAWLCSNPEQAAGYLREITRLVRECGITVPLINANDLWQDIPGTIDTWRGNEELLAHLRQLRAVQPDAPRLLSEFDISLPAAWGERIDNAKEPATSPEVIFSQLAQCLAAGAQPIVSPFVGGTNFGFLGGRMPGSPDRFATTSAAYGAAVDEGGTRTERFHLLKRLVTFASHFGHVFAELAPESQPIVPLPPEVGAAASSKAGTESDNPLTVVPLIGSQGTIIFLFHPAAEETANAKGRRSKAASKRKTTLLLSDGVAMPVELGEQPVSWVVLNVDLSGIGRLDYANISPYAMVNRSILVLFGPSKAQAHLSISGSPLTTTVPSGEKPMVVQHKGVTIVILSEEQIDRTYLGDDSVYVGAAGLATADRGRSNGAPIPVADGKPPWMITSDGSIKRVPADELADSIAPKVSKRVPLKDWQGCSAELYATGQSPRYATLDGPCTLASCGAPTGYGWYRIRLQSKTTRRRLCHLPEAAHRVHLFLTDDSQTGESKSLGVVGVGPGAGPRPFEIHLPRGELTLTALVDNLGRFSAGNDLGERTGFYGHLLEIKTLRAGQPKQVNASPVNPFVLRGYIEHRVKSQLSSSQHWQWTFTHTRKSSILIDVQGVLQSGTFILNDEPIAYHPGTTGAAQSCFTIGQTINESFKRGKNELRFAPDAHQDISPKEVTDGIALYECDEAITEGASWAFARWEPPEDRAYEATTKTGAKRLRNKPAWWRCTFNLPRGTKIEMLPPVWFDVAGLSKGQVFINGRNLGRYFTQTATGKSIGPQTRLSVPGTWLHQNDDNVLLIFDEHGFDPYRSRLHLGE